MSLYSREALERSREAVANPPARKDPLDEIPPDAEYENPEAALHVWNGAKWITWEKWRATAPVLIEERPGASAAPSFPPGTECITAVCGGTRVWIVKESSRYLMSAGSRWSGRRRDFASPFIEHAIRTAEQWYGAPAEPWRAEGVQGSGGRRKTASVPPQIEGARKRGNGDVDMEGQEPEGR
jgi:hypothetical protein